MNHLIVCREYPPVPGGGIGTYTANLAHLLASRGENVAVVAQQWHGAQRAVEHKLAGRLTIHRLPYDNWAAPWGRRVHPALTQPARGLFNTHYPPLAFAWQAAELIERLVELYGIDLIEAPEYEAPLYVFMLRRALGLGPRRQPPCLIQLHSPTEFIAHSNGWPLGAADLTTAAQLEAYTISAADGLLCPSRSLASAVADRYRVRSGDIAVIPLPIAPNREGLKRAPSVWANGSVCYVGRLEPRKGIFEYLEAAVAVAQDRPDLVFEFAGANVLGTDPLSSAALLDQRIPPALRRQFRFLGELPRAALRGVLRRARLAVVPSRWENFPYVCVEAMQSGLPVLATCQGAMPDMIVDGQSGWLVPRAEPQALIRALRRALATSPTDRQAMGIASAQAIQALCDPDRLVAQQLALRSELVRQGPTRSSRLPALLPTTHLSRMEPMARRQPRPSRAQGLAVVIANENQNVPAAVQAALLASPPPIGVVLMCAGDTLAPDFVARCADVFAHCPEVGVIGGWATLRGEPGRLQAPPCPTFPEQWVTNAALLPLAVRAEAFDEAGGLPTGPLASTIWELANAVLAAGWVGVTLPMVWAERKHPGVPVAALSGQARQRFAAQLRNETLVAPATPASKRPYLALQPDPLSWRGRLVLLRRSARSPRVLCNVLWWLARRLVRSAALAPPLWLAAASPTKPASLPATNHG